MNRRVLIDGCRECHRVVSKRLLGEDAKPPFLHDVYSCTRLLCHQFMPHKKLPYDADKKCQYLKDDCVF